MSRQATKKSGSRKKRTIKKNKILRYKKKSLPVASLSNERHTGRVQNGTRNTSTGGDEPRFQEEVWRYIECHSFRNILEGAVNLYALGISEAHDYKPDNYCLVMLLNLVTADGKRTVGCCSNCTSNDMVGYFALADHEETSLNDSMLFSCIHIEAVSQRVLSANGHNCTSKDMSQHWLDISESLNEYDNNLNTGWYHITSILHKRGPIHAYISEEYTLYVFGVKKTIKESPIYFCFKCGKYSCHHSRSVTHTFEGNVPILLRDIYTKPLNEERLHSKEGYSCMD